MITLNANDVDVGKILGIGGFSSVFSVRIQSMVEFDRLLVSINGCDEEDSACDKQDADDATAATVAETLARFAGAGHSSSLSSLDTTASCYQEPQHLAMKRLHTMTLKCRRTTKRAFDDMHNEVVLLSQLPSHPNIITLYGISADFWTSPSTAFFVQEQLEESLDKTIERWRQDSTSDLGRFAPFARRNRASESQARRVKKVAVGIARAMAFLHEQRIIFRDLKPENVGLDEHGCVRLFDFGLAKRVESKEKEYKLTPCVGTLRYMAPEVALSQPYSFSADVHSFGMFLWEVCALEKPFARCKCRDSLSMRVMLKGKNPSLTKIGSKSIKVLLSQCWAEPQERPTFERVLEKLNG